MNFALDFYPYLNQFFNKHVIFVHLNRGEMLVNYKSEDTICAIATGTAVAAIAVIRVSGKDAISMVETIFSKPLINQSSHTVHFGVIQDEQGEPLDEVLVTVFQDGKSFTGEPAVEIACHASPYIKTNLLKLLVANGCRMADPGEFTMRAFFNGKMDLSQAEAIADLIAADSAKSHALAMNQMRGGYSNEILDLKQKLIDFASLIELELDFSEEDVEFASREELWQLLALLKKKLSSLISSFSIGSAIKNGVQTVIAGRPNAGKSTLLNVLLNEERAIVSDIAGTTRDTIEAELVVDGVVFRLIDTAGIREAEDEIERIGVSKTMSEVKKSAVLIYVYDAKALTREEVEKDLEALSNGSSKIIVLANKMDITDESAPALSEKWKDIPVIPTTAKTGEGITQLKAQFQAFVQDGIGESDTIVVNARHLNIFAETLKDVEKIELGLQQQIPGDLLAMDIRSAIRNLSAITGEISTDDLLGNIFANFCIGK